MGRLWLDDVPRAESRRTGACPLTGVQRTANLGQHGGQVKDQVALQLGLGFLIWEPHA